MKTRLPITVAVAAVMITSIGTSIAIPYVDNASTKLLLHMDSRSAGGPFTTPDDDSANPGRDHEFLIRDDHFDTVATDAKFVAGQVGYGSALHLDGVTDSLSGFTGVNFDDLGVVATDEIRLDISAKSDMVPNGDNSVHSLVMQPNRYQILFYDRSQGDWRIDFRIWTDTGLKTVAVTDGGTGIDITEWHEYSVTWENGIVEGLIDGVSVGTTVTTGTVLDGALRDMWVGADHANTKHWGGTVDELRLSVIPEPSTLTLLGVVGGAVLFVRKKYSF